MKKIFAAIAIALMGMAAPAAASTAAADTASVHLEYSAPKRAAQDVRANCEKTRYTTNIGGREYPIYVTTKNRRAFVILVSKSKGTEYRKYLGEEMTQRVNSGK